MRPVLKPSWMSYAFVGEYSQRNWREHNKFEHYDNRGYHTIKGYKARPNLMNSVPFLLWSSFLVIQNLIIEGSSWLFSFIKNLMHFWDTCFVIYSINCTAITYDNWWSYKHRNTLNCGAVKQPKILVTTFSINNVLPRTDSLIF